VKHYHVLEMLNATTHAEREALFRHLSECDECRLIFIQTRRD